MTSVTIIPIADENGGTMYRAICGQHRSSGKTAGEALDALTTQLPLAVTFLTSKDRELLLAALSTQDLQPDVLFPAESQIRLRALMAEWRHSRDASTPFDSSRKAELDSLVDAELAAAAQRAATATQDSMLQLAARQQWIKLGLFP